jgi:hypothetical protein
MYALLASHPNIAMVRRTNTWRWFYGQFGDLSEQGNFERCLETMLRYKRLRHLNPDPERIRREFWEGEPSYGRLFALLYQHHAEREGKRRWGDKSLHTEHHADDVFAEFPRARMIHMIRDPRDRYASVLNRYDDKSRGVASATGRWLASTRMAKRNLRLYPDRYITVRYESLASNPEEILKKVCAFIGEAYDPVMLTMSGAPRHRKTGGNSSFTKFEPGTISTRSIGRFRQVVAESDIAFIQTTLGQEMITFDYIPESVQMSPVSQAYFYLGALPVNLVRMAGWLTIETIAQRRGRNVPASRFTEIRSAERS